MRGRAKTWILIKSMTTPNAIAAPNSPATIATGNDAIAITKIASVQMITTPAAEACGSRLCVHPLDPLCAPCGSHKSIRKVLCLPRNLVAPELQDAHGVTRFAVIRQDEFSDPKVAGTEDAPHGKALLVRLRKTRRLNIAPAANPFTGLRVLKHGIVVINLVLCLEVIRVRGGPVAIQSRSNIAIVIHCLLTSLAADAAAWRTW